MNSWKTRAIQMILVFNLLCNTATCLHSKCLSHDLGTPSSEWYCPVEGNIPPTISLHHCKIYCLHTPGCEAVNHNLTTNFCTQLTVTCPKGHKRSRSGICPLQGYRARTIHRIDSQAEWSSRWRPICDWRQQAICIQNAEGFVCYFGLMFYDCLANDDNG